MLDPSWRANGTGCAVVVVLFGEFGDDEECSRPSRGQGKQRWRPAQASDIRIPTWKRCLEHKIGGPEPNQQRSMQAWRQKKTVQIRHM